MSHGIIKPIDKVISTEGTEWHGLADVAEQINDETVRPLLFSIVTGKIMVKIGEDEVPMSNHKALVADYREVRPDLTDDEDTSAGLVPLHIPKNSYLPIENRQVWDSMSEALKDVDAKITCAGTLDAGKKFFLSAQLGDGGAFTVNNDKFLANLNFITSHDGSLAVEAYDSTVRICCLNTLRWSREAAGEIGFKVYHSKNADCAMKNLGDLVNRIITGRADFRTSMEYLASQPISPSDARNFILGYFGSITAGEGKSAELSTRSENATDDIIGLFNHGKGNNGKTLYSLLNGVTEYWTSGDGTGKKADAAGKMYKANFGRAADHKDAICNALLSENRVKELIEIGKKQN